MQARWDDLQYRGLGLYQSPALPCFSQDSVLLAAFADLGAQDIAVDIGAGTGALCTLCAARTSAKVTAVEKDAALCALLRKSVARNGMDIPVHELDWADAPRVLGHGAFTAALCNPPYFGAGTRSPDASRALTRSGANARSGTDVPGGMDGPNGADARSGANARSGASALDGAVFAASRLLKNGGRLYLCYPAAGLADALCALRAQRLEPKRLRLVAQDACSAPYLALILARLGARPQLDVLPPLLLRDADGNESAEYREIYHME